jgi:protein-S-isoprenylcysteine O-methyltransferase Ste14
VVVWTGRAEWDERMRKAAAAVGSVLFFSLAPGIVAGVIPWWLTRWQMRKPLPYWAPLRVVGLLLIGIGAVVLVHAFVRFVVEGAGTPAPVAPTERLVVGGLYRHVRNPMYLAVVSIIVGQALALGQPALLTYGLGVWVVFAAFVKLYEEPVLRRRYGAYYDAYRRAVPAWLPRLHAWRAGDDAAGAAAPPR